MTATHTAAPEAATILTEQELADRWGCSVATLRTKRSRGEDMPRYFKAGRFVRYFLDDVIAWERSKYVN